MNHVIVRKCEPGELAQVKELFETVFVNTFHDHAPVFDEVTDGEIIYVALLNDSIVGFASIWEPDQFIQFFCAEQTEKQTRNG